MDDRDIRQMLFHCACGLGDVAKVAAMLNEGDGAVLANGSDQMGFSPLHTVASGVGDDPLAIVALLLAAEADLHAKDLKGRTPLHLAAHGRNDQLVAALLAAGADVHCTDGAGYTPLHWAAVSPYALRPQNGAILEALAQAGADPNARDHDGRTPLLAVAPRLFPSLAAALVALGCDPDAVDHQRQGVFDAMVGGEPELVRAAMAHALAERGAAEPTGGMRAR